jgi:hypothetical protein
LPFLLKDVGINVEQVLPGGLVPLRSREDVGKGCKEVEYSVNTVNIGM